MHILYVTKFPFQTFKFLVTAIYKYLFKKYFGENIKQEFPIVQI